MPETFTYFHIDLEEHALLVAEGVPAESFIDNVEPVAFDNHAERVALYGDVPPIPEMDLPRVASARQLPRAVRERIAAAAVALAGPAQIWVA